MNRAVRFELDHTVALGKKSEVIALPNEKTRPKPAAALADNDASCSHKLATVGFYAKPLRIGVTTVSGTTLSFCMRHLIFPGLFCSLDFLHLKAKKILAVSLFDPRIFAAAETEVNHLRAAELFKQLTNNTGSLNQRVSHLNVLAV